MKKFLIIFSILVLVLAASQFDPFGNGERALAQTGDLCGNTSGNGAIVSIGNNSFTLLHNDGRNLIVNLTSQATIETSTSFASLSDLKAGDRVTLVGDDNRDGTFTANAVVVCGGTEVQGTGEVSPITVRNNDANYEKVSGAINTATMLLVGLIWLGMVAFLTLKKKKNLVYLLFFTIFYIYLYKVLDYTLLQFQSLLLLQHFLPNLILNGIEAGKVVNFIPLATLTLEDVKTSALNILMMMPFGFGLPFITNFRIKKIVIVGFFFSIAIELLQLITGFMANTTFRIADINDLIFNTAGVAVGYILFVGFVRLCRYTIRNWKMRENPILRYIVGRPQIKNGVRQ